MRTAGSVPRSARASRFVLWTARVALVALAMQIAALGHWDFGPFHSATRAEALASHASHCHGSVSGCAGEPSFSGTYIESPLLTVMPAATIPLPADHAASPTEAVLPQPDQPPRSG